MQRNLVRPSPRTTAKTTAGISSRYQFVSFPLDVSSDNAIARAVVEHACSAIIRLRRGWWSLYAPVTSMLTLLQSLSLASSEDPREDEIPPVGSSRVISRSSEVLPETSTPKAQLKEKLDTIESPQGGSIFKKWLPRKSDKDPTSHKPEDRHSPSDSPMRVDATSEGPSWMAAGKRKRVSALPRETIGYDVSDIS